MIHKSNSLFPIRPSCSFWVGSLLFSFLHPTSSHITEFPLRSSSMRPICSIPRVMYPTPLMLTPRIPCYLISCVHGALSKPVLPTFLSYTFQTSFLCIQPFPLLPRVSFKVIQHIAKSSSNYALCVQLLKLIRLLFQFESCV